MIAVIRLDWKKRRSKVKPQMVGAAPSETIIHGESERMCQIDRAIVVMASNKWVARNTSKIHRRMKYIDINNVKIRSDPIWSSELAF
jgi:hypothetical protein